MTPNQPEKKEYSRVDAYFRQNAEDIPVTFDPANWNALAAALDAAAGNPTKTLVHRPNRLGKCWWVSGVFLLALSGAWWIWQAPLNASAPDVHNEVGMLPFDSTELSTSNHKRLLQKTRVETLYRDSVDLNLPKSIPIELAPYHKEAFQKTKSDLVKAPSLSAEDSTLSNLTNASIDSAVSQQMEKLSAHDSLVTPPAKKKKHIFW